MRRKGCTDHQEVVGTMAWKELRCRSGSYTLPRGHPRGNLEAAAGSGTPPHPQPPPRGSVGDEQPAPLNFRCPGCCCRPQTHGPLPGHGDRRDGAGEVGVLGVHPPHPPFLLCLLSSPSPLLALRTRLVHCCCRQWPC